MLRSIQKKENEREQLMKRKESSMRDQIDPNTVIHEEKGDGACSGTGWKALTFDAALYERMIEEQDLSDDAKHELLGAMWTIIVNFVDLGFEVKFAGDTQEDNPETCGQPHTAPQTSGAPVLDCPLTQAINETFAAAMSADGKDSKTKEEV